MLKKDKKFLFFSLLILTIPTLFTFFENADHWLVDMLSHFPVQYALSALIFFLICLWKRFVTLTVLAGFLFFLNISTIVDFGDTIHAAEHGGTPVKIYSANLHKENYDLSQLNKEVQEIDPDIILLLEVTPVHSKQLLSLMHAYQYHTEKRSFGGPEIGFLFLSKFPIIDNHVTKLSEVCNFFLEATLEIDQRPVAFYGVHAQRPDIRNYAERKDQYLWLAQRISKQTSPVIVTGDFNSAPYAQIFRDFIELTGLKDSRERAGWQPSWPTYFPPLWIPIDHVLVSPDIQIRKRTIGSYIGSDHYPVIAELSLG